MSDSVRFFKVVATLPPTLVADALYAVRVGSGFDLYLTDHTGVYAHKLNGGQAPAAVTTITADTSITADTVIEGAV